MIDKAVLLWAIKQRVCLKHCQHYPDDGCSKCMMKIVFEIIEEMPER